jgi:hypothetical protein
MLIFNEIVVVGVGLRLRLGLGLRLRLQWWRRKCAAVEAKHGVRGLLTVRHFDVERREWSGGGGEERMER